ncbi:stalk domain-containing protein [Gorillibacterium massiliense]|uniref:stalk domain-containing protein n=1 Tax=Gorillibacterium massiliense TaxID=1280390 RepID=UPI0004B6F864|nr:stalk domain-containing protein [Gorillibacterium massiliense]
MKKIIVSSFICAALFIGGGASAAAVNGMFQGKEIVKVTSSGNEVKAGDVPAYIDNGRTMVPIYLLRDLGASVAWDEKTRSVDVSLPQQSDNHVEIDELKVKSILTDQFNVLQSFGESLTQLSSGYNLAYDGLQNGSTMQLKMMNDNLNDVTKAYNDTINIVLDLNKQLESTKYLNNDITSILTSYSNAIELYKFCDSVLNNYAQTKEAANYTIYLNSSFKGYDAALDGLTKARNKYLANLALLHSS